MERLHTLLKTKSREETLELGKRLGRKLGPGSVVALSGPLGSGKTTLAKGLAMGLGVPDERIVKSPTYVIMHQYQGRCPVYHLDLYRLNGLRDVEALGWDDLLASNGVILVEWAHQIEGYLPAEYLDIELKIDSETGRDIALKAGGPAFQSIVREIAG